MGARALSHTHTHGFSIPYNALIILCAIYKYIAICLRIFPSGPAAT